MIIILSNIIINSITINIINIINKIDNVKIIYKLNNDDLNNDNLYIILFLSDYKILPKKYIYYQIEQLNSPFFNKINLITNPLNVWVLSNFNTLFYKKNCVLFKVYCCPLPFYCINNNNNNNNDNEIKYDILFYGKISKRRKRILKEIKKKYNIKIINYIYGDKLIEYIYNSKIILNFHLNKMTFLETCKLNEVLNYNKVIISELPHNYDYQNKYLYFDLVVFFDIIKDNLSNINLLFNLIDYYLIPNNYINFISKLEDNKKKLQNITTNIFLQKLNIINNINKKLIYYPNEDLFQYLKYSNNLLPFKFILKKINFNCDNCFNIDVNFYKYINDIELNFISTLKHISSYGIENGLIYHPKQIKNLFSSLEIYSFCNNYYVEDNELKEFVKKNIYKLTFNNFMEDFIIIKENNIINNNLLILVFIGNKSIGIKLLEKIINYKNTYSIGICFNNNDIYLELKHIILENFDNYCIGISKNYGNDIIPSLQLYWFLNKKIKFDYVIKTHTKSDLIWFNDLNDYLFSNKLNLLENNLDVFNNCNCIGNNDYYLHINDNKSFEYNTLKYFKNKYSDKINKKYFVKGTIFFCKKKIFDKVIEFMKNNNFRQYFTNNLHDSNIININNSSIHWLERLFGII